MKTAQPPAKASSARTPRINGFTLVELVVAGSAVMAMLAMLVPTLRVGRSRDQMTDCLANMRAIGQASLTYAAEDPNEILIPVPDTLGDRPGAIEWGGRSGMGQSWTTPSRSPFGTAGYRGPAHRPLNPYLYPGTVFVDYNPTGGTPNPGVADRNYISDTQLGLSLYRCPADVGHNSGDFVYIANTDQQSDANGVAYRNEGRTAYDHYGTSYAANVSWIMGGMATTQLSSSSAYLHSLSQIPSPAHSIAYQEMPSRYAWLWGGWEGSGCEFMSYENRISNSYATIPGWHGVDFNFNVTFADGHAAMVEMKGTTRPSPNLGEGNYPAEQCSLNLSGYECMRCVTNRGPGWQLDVLPADPVLTPYWSD